MQVGSKKTHHVIVQKIGLKGRTERNSKTIRIYDSLMSAEEIADKIKSLLEKNGDG